MLCIFFSFSFFFALPAQPLNFQFENYTTAEGLAGNEVYGVFKDSHNFLWIRTSSGLSKFDGIAFQNFFYNSKDTNSIPSNTIYSLCEIPRDLIFIGTDNGLAIYNNRLNCFENWRIQKQELKPGKRTVVSALMTDKQKNIWINYNGIIDVFDSLFHFKFRYTDLEQGKILNGIDIGQSNICYDKPGNMWIGHNNTGVICIEQKTLKATVMVNQEYPTLKNQSITALYVDSDKSVVWYSCYGLGLYSYDLINKTTKHFKFDNSNLFEQTEQNLHFAIQPFNDYLICASGAGLVIFNRNDESYQVIKAGNNNPFSLISDDINSLLIDNDNLLWIATAKGLSKCNLNAKTFSFYAKEFLEKENDPPVEINHFAVFKSEWIIVGTVEAGLYAYNRKTGERKHLVINHPKAITENYLGKVFVDRHNSIWVGAYYGLRIYNLEQNKIEMLPRQFAKLNQNSCITFFNDSKDGYWMSYEGDPRLIHFYDEKKLFVQKKYLYDNGSFPLQKINTIREDHIGNIWLATSWSLGFLNWNRSSNTFTRLPKVNSPNDYLSESYHDLCIIDTNKVCLASQFHGLIFYNTTTNRQINYTTDEGLASNNLACVYKHSDGKIWIGSDKGITQFDPVTKTMRNFGYEDGLPETEINGKFFYDSASHLLYARTAHHIIYFNPDSIHSKDVSFLSSGIYLKSMEVNGSLVYKDFSANINLAPYENNLNLEFSCVDFSEAKKLKFEYMLLGLETKWVHSDNRRYVTYANLKPGSYKLMVRKSSNSYDWSKAVTVTSFIVETPFYFQWWFVLLVVVVVVVVVYAVYDYRQRNRKALEKVRTRIARDLHDDIGSTLNSISIFSEIAKQKNVDVNQREHFLETIGSSSRDIIETMNDIVWTVNPMNDKFENILMRMKSFASEVSEGKEINLQFDVDENAKNISLKMDERKNFYLIFKEALNNAFKYSNASQVKVKVKVKEGLLHLIVEDNGVGFDAESKSPLHGRVPIAIGRGEAKGGNGLRNMQARADEIKAVLKINSVAGDGTVVELKVKV